MKRRKSIAGNGIAAADGDDGIDGSPFTPDAAEQRRREALRKLEAYGEEDVLVSLAISASKTIKEQREERRNKNRLGSKA